MDILIPMAIFAGIVFGLGKYFSPKVSAMIFTFLLVVGSCFIPPYGLGLMATLPLSFIVFPVMCLVFRFADPYIRAS